MVRYAARISTSKKVVAMIPLRVACGIAAALALSCNTQSAPKPNQGAEPTAAPKNTPAATTPTAAALPKKPIPARDTDPMPDPITHPCVVSAAQYTNAIEKGKTDCKTDSDCGCYQGGLGRRSGCGGVLNKESLVELSRIEAEFRKDGCKHTQQCAPWACQPKCENGHCRK